MPIVDRREFGGRFSVSENSTRLSNYRYLESTVGRLVAVYRVLEPHLVSTFVYHADATDPLADTPTVRLLHQLAGTDQSHIAWGQAVPDSLAQDPAERRRALEIQATSSSGSSPAAASPARESSRTGSRSPAPASRPRPPRA